MVSSTIDIGPPPPIVNNMDFVFCTVYVPCTGEERSITLYVRRTAGCGEQKISHTSTEYGMPLEHRGESSITVYSAPPCQGIYPVLTYLRWATEDASTPYALGTGYSVLRRARSTPNPTSSSVDTLLRVRHILLVLSQNADSIGLLSH